MKNLFYPGQHQMNPSAPKFKPKQKKLFIVNVDQLKKHEENTFKMIFEEWTNTPTLNLFNGTNLFGGVLVAVHKSIHTQRIVGFDNIPNLIALEIGVDNNKFQLVTCYSPPHEQIPFKIFDRILQINENTIITGDFNAKHNSWSRSIENPKGKTLFNWLSSLQTRSTMDIINKFIPTSTRSNATIDLIITPSHMSSNSFSVLPSIGNDHHPVIWCSTIKIFTAHQTYPIKRTHWKLFEVFLTFTGSYWNKLAEDMTHSTAFFTLYERFLSLSISRFTNVTFRKTFKPTLPQHIVYLTNEKRLHLKLFRRTYHLYYAMMLRDTTKLVQKTLFQYKRKLWLDYCGSFNDCDTKSFWQKAKRHFHSKSAPVEGFVINNSTVSTPDEMCAIAKDYYEEQFADHQHTQTDIDIEARINEKELNEILINIPSNPMNINYQQLCRVVASMKKKNSSGIDGVSNRIIKILPPNHLSIVLACMNNFATSLQTPSHWHIAKMILLSKTKSKTTSIDKTRPISLLPCFSKLFEKLFLIHFRRWINDFAILPPEQTGFRPKHNMSVRLVSMIDQIGQSL
ncbi:unnamed protein product [Rotaria magnacalcarata]|uniref:Endonuclease/exonuclease/phosphatase domain-containing protein n=1 Tax=Rotaria magnacalcarata TaxID=392030 RepID=A0A816QAY8_9BILA|nr:unnamed protein product [Rotaria magnacalcarata]